MVNSSSWILVFGAMFAAVMALPCLLYPTFYKEQLLGVPYFNSSDPFIFFTSSVFGSMVLGYSVSYALAAIIKGQTDAVVAGVLAQCCIVYLFHGAVKKRVAGEGAVLWSLLGFILAFFYAFVVYDDHKRDEGRHPARSSSSLWRFGTARWHTVSSLRGWRSLPFPMASKRFSSCPSTVVRTSRSFIFR